MKKQILLTAILLVSISNLFASAKITEISGDLSFLSTGDTVELTLNKYPDLPYGIHLYDTYTAVVKNHAFNFSFKCEEPFIYVSVSFKNKSTRALYGYLMSSGGDVNISDVNGKYVFSGKSSNEFELQQKISELSGTAYHSLPKLTPETLVPFLKGIDLNVERALDVLFAMRAGIDKASFEQLKANIVFGGGYNKCADLVMKSRSQPDSVKLAFAKSYQNYKEQRKVDWDTLLIDDQAKLHSSIYSNYVFGKFFVDSCIFKLQQLSEHRYLEYVKQNYRGELGERLSMYVILSKLTRTKDNLEGDIDRLLSDAHNPDFHRILLNIKKVNFGASALNYILTDEKNQKVALSRYFGKVVVFDFFYTGCGNCVKVAPLLRETEEHFKGRDVVFLSISIDETREMWLKSVKSQLYSSPLSMNLYTSGNGSNDPIIKGFSVNGYPTILIIDKKGRLRPNVKDPRMDAGKDLRERIEKELSAI